MHKESAPVDFQIYDIETCFDKLNIQECIVDLYDIGLINDKVVLSKSKCICCTEEIEIEY